MNPITVFLTVACLAVGAGSGPLHRDQLLCRLFEFLRRYLDGLAFVSRVDFANPFALRGASL
jgi:hypothetical protein